MCEEAADLALGAKPRHRLIISPEREVRADSRRPGAPLPSRQNPQGMDDGTQLEDVSGRIGLLCCCELAALLRDGLVLPVAVVVGLSEGSRDNHFTGVGRRNQASTRVEGEALLQVVEAPLLSLPPLPRGVWAAQAGET